MRSMSKKKSNPPHPAWSRETIAALIAEHGTPAAAARAVGLLRQRFQQLQVQYGVATPAQEPADPTAWGGSTCVKVSTEQAEEVKRVARMANRSQSFIVRAALDALIASGDVDCESKPGARVALTVYLTPEQHAWLNSHGRGSRSRLIQCALERAMKQGKKL